MCSPCLACTVTCPHSCWAYGHPTLQRPSCRVLVPYQHSGCPECLCVPDTPRRLHTTHSCRWRRRQQRGLCQDEDAAVGSGKVESCVGALPYRCAGQQTAAGRCSAEAGTQAEPHHQRMAACRQNTPASVLMVKVTLLPITGGSGDSATSDTFQGATPPSHASQVNAEAPRAAAAASSSTSTIAGAAHTRRLRGGRPTAKWWCACRGHAPCGHTLAVGRALRAVGPPAHAHHAAVLARGGKDTHARARNAFGLGTCESTPAVRLHMTQSLLRGQRDLAHLI